MPHHIQQLGMIPVTFKLPMPPENQAVLLPPVFEREGLGPSEGEATYQRELRASLSTYLDSAIANQDFPILINIYGVLNHASRESVEAAEKLLDLIDDKLSRVGIYSYNFTGRPYETCSRERRELSAGALFEPHYSYALIVRDDGYDPRNPAERNLSKARIIHKALEHAGVEAIIYLSCEPVEWPNSISATMPRAGYDGYVNVERVNALRLQLQALGEECQGLYSKQPYSSEKHSNFSSFLRNIIEYSDLTCQDITDLKPDLARIAILREAGYMNVNIHQAISIPEMRRIAFTVQQIGTNLQGVLNYLRLCKRAKSIADIGAPNEGAFAELKQIASNYLKSLASGPGTVDELANALACDDNLLRTGC